MAKGDTDLIELIELDQPRCALEYGGDHTNLLLYTEEANGPAWQHSYDGSQVLESAALNSAPPADLPTARVSPVRCLSPVGGYKNQQIRQEILEGDWNIVNEPIVVTVYVKFGTPPTLSNYLYVSFDLPADNAPQARIESEAAGGSWVTTDNDGTAAVEDAGDGWFKVTLTGTMITTGTPYFKMSVSDHSASPTYPTYAGDDGDVSFFFTGARLSLAADASGPYVRRRGGDSTGCAAALGVTGDEKCFRSRATCQDPDAFTAAGHTLKFCKPDQLLPSGYLPFLKSVNYTPSRLNTASKEGDAPLGQRAKLTATFYDGPSTDNASDFYAEERRTGAARDDGIGYDPFERGTFWGKWRARNLYYLNSAIRAYTGVGQFSDLDALPERHYIVTKTAGPSASGMFSITAKDPLKLADDDKAQAPQQSGGRLLASITNVATSATLTPTGVGDAEYPAAGKCRINNEVMVFARTGDTLTLTRAQHNTAAAAHDDDDLVQLCLEFTSEPVPLIVQTLLYDYAGISLNYIDGSKWLEENGAYISGAYSALITTPTAVKKLVGELAIQAGFSLWWSETENVIKFSAVKPPEYGASVITDDWIIADTLSIADDPDARVDTVWLSFGQIDPTKNLDEPANYRGNVIVTDADASDEYQYGQLALRKIQSRWISQYGETVAQDIGDRLVNRFRDVIRTFTFDLPDYRAEQIHAGDSHSLLSQHIVDAYGDPEKINVRILSVLPVGDRIKVEAEELKFFNGAAATERNIVIASDTENFNVNDAHDDLFVPLVGGETINVTIEEGVTVYGQKAFHCGSVTWPAGVTLNVINNGAIRGRGGKGGDGYTWGSSGGIGGNALIASKPLNLTNNGIIAGGGGGGTGGPDSDINDTDGGGGGGGAGYPAGSGGGSGGGGWGQDGTLNTGGAGGAAGSGSAGGGGAGGDLGEDGSGTSGTRIAGAAGKAIDGVSNVTFIETGTITGPQTG